MTLQDNPAWNPDKLEEEMRKDAMAGPDVPLSPRVAKVHEFPKSDQPTKTTMTQGIARDCTKLTWREAEAMAKGIEAKQKEGNATLVHAIQAWAWEWKTFKEEEQPGS